MIRLFCALAVLIGLAPDRAGAAPACEPVDETGLLGLINQAKDAIDSGDAETHRVLVGEIRGRFPCVPFAVRPRHLADFFVLEAIAHFTAGEDWRPSLDAALRIRPSVDRFVGSAHPLARHPIPSAADQGPTRVPDDVTVHVDGEPSTRLPTPGTRHLIQVMRDGRWRSTFTDGALPEGFFTEPIRAPAELRAWGHASATLGVAGVAQRHPSKAEIRAGEVAWTPDQSTRAAWPGLVLRGGLDYGSVGVSGELDVGLLDFARAAGSHAQVGVVAGARRVRFGGGIGVGASTTIQAPREAQSGAGPVDWEASRKGLVYPFASAALHQDRWDAGASFGLGPSCERGAFYVGAAPLMDRGDLPLRVGLSGSAQRARFEESGTDALVRTWTWRVGIEVGLTASGP